MKKVIALIALFLISINLFASEAKQSLVVNLTSSDAIRAPMAVHFAMKALDRKIDTTLFLNVEGVRLAVEKFNTPINAKTGGNVQDMIKGFMKKGGKVIICPMCLSANGYDKSDLIKGVEMGTPDTVFPAIMNSDKVVSY